MFMVLPASVRAPEGREPPAAWAAAKEIIRALKIITQPIGEVCGMGLRCEL